MAMSDKERARQWDVVVNLRLTVMPPPRKGEEWVARTVGGSQDPNPMIGYGKTPENAVANIKPREETK